jgi:hypothetical protein
MASLECGAGFACNCHAGQAIGVIYFHLNDDTLKTNDSAGKYSGEHECSVDE